MQSHRFLLLMLVLASGGCTVGPINRSFSLTRPQAEHDLQRMAASPKAMDRPVVIIGGFLDLGVMPTLLRLRLSSVTRNPQLVEVGIGECLSMAACREKIIDVVDRTFPSPNSQETVEVDVIGQSLGGLAAQYASLRKGPHARRLRIARLFTISSPLAGAQIVQELPPLHPIMNELRQGSKFMTAMRAAKLTYPVFSYVRLGDVPVGTQNAAMLGQRPWWLATPVPEDAHNGAMCDVRIMADIFRRLRREVPFATLPPAALPDNS